MPFVAPQDGAVVHRVGAGSVCEVALVEIGGERMIAKRLRPSMLAHRRAQISLEREYAFLSRVEHPSLPRVLGHGDDSWGPYLLQTQMAGLPLRELVAGFVGRGQPMPSVLLKRVARAVGSALAEVHALSADEGSLEIVHGDLGPDHVLIQPDMRIGFIDWGQARWRGMQSAWREHGGEIGTPPYVAPEIARGEQPPSQAGDVFAVAASLAFAALGHPPCRARSAAAKLVEIADHGLTLDGLEERLGGAPGLHAGLRRALQFEPAKRLLRAADLAALVQAD